MAYSLHLGPTGPLRTPPLGRTIRAAETPAVRLGDSHVPADQEEDASRIIARGTSCCGSDKSHTAGSAREKTGPSTIWGFAPSCPT